MTHAQRPALVALRPPVTHPALLRLSSQALDALLDLQELRIQKLDKEFRENLSMVRLGIILAWMYSGREGTGGVRVAVCVCCHRHPRPAQAE